MLTARVAVLVAAFGVVATGFAAIAAATPADLHDVFTDELQVRSTTEPAADLDDLLEGLTR